MSTLVIIGNGFDQAHKLKTSYDDFIKNKSDEALDRFKEFWERYYDASCPKCGKCTYFKDQTTWNNFELGMCSMTDNMSHLSFDDNYDYPRLMSDIAELNNSYDRIRALLAEYLGEEMDRHASDLKKRSDIADYIGVDTPVICFNYTRTAEMYSSNVFYIHGSLAEDYIVLGYDDIRSKFDVEDPVFTEWDKSYRRDELGLLRYIRHKRRRHREDKITSILRDFKRFNDALPCRGIDAGLRRELKYYRWIKRWSRKTSTYGYGFNIDLSKIDRIVIIGHSLFSDAKLLDGLFKDCKALKTIVLFCYEGEDQKEKKIARREEFLRKYCDNIIRVAY